VTAELIVFVLLLCSLSYFTTAVLTSREHYLLLRPTTGAASDARWVLYAVRRMFVVVHCSAKRKYHQVMSLACPVDSEGSD